jgi:hypothetical protein
MKQPLASVLLAVVAACGGGDDGGGTKDGNTTDMGEPDAPTFDDVTVKVISAGAPVAGATVVFQATDGSTIKTADTDATGTAQASMPLGGNVTVIEGGASPKLRSYLGVTKGESLEVLETAPSAASINVMFPADAAATNYDVHVLCGAGGAKSTTTTTVSGLSVADCGGTGDVLVLSRNAGGTFLNALFVKDVSIDDGQTAVLAGSYSPVQMESFAWAHADLYTGGDALRFDAFQTTANGAFLESFASPLANGSGDASFASLSAKASAAGAVGLRDAVVSAGHISTSSFQKVVDLGTPATTYALDVSAATLPAYDLVPAFDGAAHAITWTASGGAVTPDATRGVVTVTRGATTWEWALAGAYVDGSLTYPVLPADAGAMDFNPTTGDTVQIQHAELISLPGGYDALRPLAFQPSGDQLEDFGLAIKAGTTARVITADFTGSIQ